MMRVNNLSISSSDRIFSQCSKYTQSKWKNTQCENVFHRIKKAKENAQEAKVERLQNEAEHLMLKFSIIYNKVTTCVTQIFEE